MENLKGLKIFAYRTSKDDYLGVVTFFNPKLPQPKKRFSTRPSVDVMFTYELPLDRGYRIRFDDGAGIEEYLEENNLIDEFIDLVNQAIDSNDFKVV